MRFYSVSLVAVLAASTPAAAQRLITASDLSSLSAGPPTARIAYGPSPLQFANLRLPRTAGPHPVIVLVHGGCWLSQYDISYMGKLEQALADSGFAVWSIEYHRVGDEGGEWPNSFRDVAQGADHLRQIASQYNLDLNRVIASGHSAGGGFALWLAARGKIPVSSELYVKDPLRVNAVVALAPAPDLDQLEKQGACGNVIDKLMGGSPSAHADRYAAASAMRLAPVGVPQTLVIGAKDNSWSPGGRAYFAHAREIGDSSVRLVELPESGHFEMLDPGSSSWTTVYQAFKSVWRQPHRQT